MGDLEGIFFPDKAEPLPGAEIPWREWVARHYPHVCTYPFAERHTRLWEWFESLSRGVKPRARVEVWPRGGAKSSSGELGCARLCARITRRFVLYVCETQDQADKHVGAISTLLERLDVEKAVNKFGSAKGWRREQLRTANGFNVAGIGLDKATRGVKLDEFRPDLILFDDIDSQHDSLKTVEKKKSSITDSILPAGSSDCGYLFLQNLIHEEGIVNQLVEGRAGFLLNREVPPVIPAVYGMKTGLEAQPDGANLYRIVEGVPSWEGQHLRICEEQINEWGLKAFLREAQHEVHGAGGYFFDVDALRYCDPGEVPRLLRYCRAWDLAATEGGGDWTVGTLWGSRRTVSSTSST